MDLKKIKTIYIYQTFLLLIISSIVVGCSETYNLQTNNYEELLVVEATITNELKKQEIKITKTSKFEDEDVKVELGASVNVYDNKGNNYIFNEESGIYVSENEFQAEPNTLYKLNIITSNGKRYESSNQNLTTENEIESINPEIVNKNEGRGVEINIKSYDPTNTSKYYRYKYEETYKIITPRWSDKKAVVIGPQEIALEENSLNTKTCYTTKKSNDIILTNTVNLNEDRVNFPVRFISDQNYIISHRYSILVTQYVQNFESYNFYRIMKEISSNASVLSPRQPGILNGNIKCLTNNDEKVIGFFDVSSASSKRIFFNYKDLFPGEEIPPYFTDCTLSNYKFCFGFGDPPCMGYALINGLKSNSITYFFLNPEIDYIMAPVECGDCTSFSSNIIPPFWTE
ncbi:DUF4249 domain-containing protein [Flavobacterium sp. CF136]|uniref:DUF4249 domain-containing protein n=1 Tax=Flavobacterium sp. (strain CF136) TaxID=1144313 RepID=UPI000271C961|nr:DUF4249 domain-containing protein [Flavobacterium sp. CF136]EJL66065.1 hypothetical protein PMI10_00815 [Flavobacterium sp. CF136]